MNFWILVQFEKGLCIIFRYTTCVIEHLLFIHFRYIECWSINVNVFHVNWLLCCVRSRTCNECKISLKSRKYTSLLEKVGYRNIQLPWHSIHHYIIKKIVRQIFKWLICCILIPNLTDFYVFFSMNKQFICTKLFI